MSTYAEPLPGHTKKKENSAPIATKQDINKQDINKQEMTKTTTDNKSEDNFFS